MENKSRKKQTGITLIALIITVIILLLLSGITISSLTGSGLFEKAQQAEQKSEDAQILENITLSEYENWLGNYITGTGTVGGGQTPPADPTIPTNPATTLAEAQSAYMLDKEVNSKIQDAYGNKIVVPAGFKITTGAATVDKGIVIEDENENQFVWIPVPKNGFIKGENGANVNDIPIILDRYTFADDEYATPEEQGTDKISNCYQELQESPYENTIAKSITNLKNSVEENEGYYIGRYEARYGASGLVTKGSETVYNNISQPDAATLSRNMYTNQPFESDLMNSYAWDTATLFLQECGTNSTYSRQKRVSSSFASTGTNNETTQDVQCNVYDMASNLTEWTTETSSATSGPSGPCVFRGNDWGTTTYYMSQRSNAKTYTTSPGIGFRPLLYL